MKILMVGIAERAEKNRHGKLDIRGFSGPSGVAYTPKLPALVPEMAVVVYFRPEAGERGKEVRLRVDFLDPGGKAFRPPVRAVVTPSATTKVPHPDQDFVVNLSDLSLTQYGSYKIRVTQEGREATAAVAYIDVVAISLSNQARI